MATTDKLPKPLFRSASLKSRSPLRDKLGQVTKSIFVAGGENAPEVEIKVIPGKHGQLQTRARVMNEHNLFHCPYAFFTSTQLPLLGAASYFDILVCSTWEKP